MNNITNYKYHNPVKISFGLGKCVEAIKDIIGKESYVVGVFYEKAVMDKLGVIREIEEALPNCEIIKHSDMKSNPEISDLKAFINNRNDLDDWIIGIGGGSTMDFAKSVAFLSPQEFSLEDMLEKKPVDPVAILPLIAVPTTSGTGSEVTPWATFWDKNIKKKYSLSHKLMFSNHAVVDPELTLTLPLYVTASTAFDAMAHALEAFWSKFSNPISDIYALEALGLVANNLKALMDKPDNIELRSCMSSAALYAGLAFSNTKTTAVHSVSYPMTLYYNIPHGAACALLLGEFLVFNKSHITPVKLSRLADVLGCENVFQIKELFKQLADDTGLPITLKQAGIPPEGVEVIVKEGFHPERVHNNPRNLTPRYLEEMLNSVSGF